MKKHSYWYKDTTDVMYSGLKTLEDRVGELEDGLEGFPQHDVD